MGRVWDSEGHPASYKEGGSAGYADMRGCRVLTTFSHVSDKHDIVERVRTEARLLRVKNMFLKSSDEMEK